MARSVRRVLVALGVVLVAPFIAVAIIVVHESGHTVVSRLLGDGRAYFVLYRGGRQPCIGCNFYDSQLFGPWANVLVNLGGVLATTLLTLFAIAVIGWRGRPRVVPRWLALEVALICLLGDMLYLLRRAGDRLEPPNRRRARQPAGLGVHRPRHCADHPRLAPRPGPEPGWVNITARATCHRPNPPRDRRIQNLTLPSTVKSH